MHQFRAPGSLGPQDILLSGAGAHKTWIARYYPCDEPNTCLISNGVASMSFALPGAIGANMVYPDRRVLAVAGDGGFTEKGPSLTIVPIDYRENGLLTEQPGKIAMGI